MNDVCLLTIFASCKECSKRRGPAVIFSSSVREDSAKIKFRVVYGYEGRCWFSQRSLYVNPRADKAPDERGSCVGWNHSALSVPYHVLSITNKNDEEELQEQSLCTTSTSRTCNRTVLQSAQIGSARRTS